MNQTKICTKCKTEKELTEFSKHKRNKDGLQCECKQCCKEYLSLCPKCNLTKHDKIPEEFAAIFGKLF